jgi:hypothetical protein
MRIRLPCADALFHTAYHAHHVQSNSAGINLPLQDRPRRPRRQQRVIGRLWAGAFVQRRKKMCYDAIYERTHEPCVKGM